MVTVSSDSEKSSTLTPYAPSMRRPNAHHKETAALRRTMRPSLRTRGRARVETHARDQHEDGAESTHKGRWR